LKEDQKRKCAFICLPKIKFRVLSAKTGGNINNKIDSRVFLQLRRRDHERVNLPSETRVLPH
jgi:hypothetical protein